MRKWILFGVFVAAVLGFFFAITGKKAAYIPGDDSHRGLKVVAACLECHGPGREFALKKEHPPKEQCFECHKRPKGRA